MANELRTRDGLPFNFVDGLRIKGVDVTNWDKVFIDQGASYVGFTPVGNLGATNVQGALAELDVEKVDNSALAATAGSSLVGHDGSTVQAVLDTVKPIANYTALRAYTGSATQVRVTTTDIAGFFYRDDADTTSADNGGTVIVSSNGKRWKRSFSGPVYVKWFGAKGNDTEDDTISIQKAVDYCTVNFTNPTVLHFEYGIYKITDTIKIRNTIHLTGDKGVFNGSAPYLKLYSADAAKVAIEVGTGTSTYVYNFIMDNISITRNGLISALPTPYNTDQTGLFLNRVSESIIRDCAIGGFKYGILCYEVTITDFDKLQVYYNEVGVWLQDQLPGGSSAYTNGMINFNRCNIFKNKHAVSLGGEIINFTGCHFEVSNEATFYIDNALTAQTRHINIKGCNVRNEHSSTARMVLIKQGNAADILRVFQLQIENSFSSVNSSPYAIEVDTSALTSHTVRIEITNSSFFGVSSAAVSSDTQAQVGFHGQIRVRELVTGGGLDMPMYNGSVVALGNRLLSLRNEINGTLKLGNNSTGITQVEGDVWYDPANKIGRIYNGSRNLRVGAPDRAGVMMKLASDAVITNNVTTLLSWGSNVYNDYGFWVIGSPTRLTVPSGVAKIRLSASVLWATNATGVRIIDVIKNGTGFDGRSTLAMTASASQSCQELVSPIILVTAGDYFEIRVTQSSGGDLNVTADQRTWVSVEVVE